MLATGQALTLSVREFELLVAMARRPGAIVTREELYATVWGGELRHGDRSVDVYVSKLRGKLEAAMPDRRFIHTHPGFGYRFQPAAFATSAHGDAAGGSMRTTSLSRNVHTRHAVKRLHAAGPARSARSRRTQYAQSSQRRRSDQEQDWRARERARCSRSASPHAAAQLTARPSSSSSSSALEQRRPGRSPAPARRSRRPVYEQWASSQSGLTVNYQAVGSGAGITALESKTVDFGASDPPLKPEDEEAIAKNGSPAVQIPMFLGAITVSYNLPGVKTGLKLDGKTIADIFLGKVKTWDDAEIKALNPGVSLPSTAITVDPPLGLLGHDGRLHRLPRRGRPRIQEQGRRRQGRAVADRHGRQGQRRRRRRRQADRRRRRLRRAGLRAAAQIHLRGGEEQGRASSSRRRSPRRPRRRRA